MLKIIYISLILLISNSCNVIKYTKIDKVDYPELITPEKERIKTRCMLCGLGDGDTEDSCHQPFKSITQPAYSTETTFGATRRNPFVNENFHYTPLIVADGLLQNFSSQVKSYCFNNCKLREIVRRMIKIILTETIYPPPLITISAGSYDLSLENLNIDEVEDKESKSFSLYDVPPIS